MHNEIDIDRVRAVEQEILDVIVEMCDRRGLQYSLAYGTLLGAIRHDGFIPWDDDIDIILPRKDYEAFIRCWVEEQPSGFLLEDSRFHPAVTVNFARVNKADTLFLSEGRDPADMRYYCGIHVDVFPMDRVPKSSLGRTAQFIAACVHNLYLRRYASSHGGVIGLGERLLLKTKPENYLKRRAAADRFLQRWNGRGEDLMYVDTCMLETCRCYYPATLFSGGMEMHVFGGKEYKITKNWNEFLHTAYGDYMQFPPESERVWTHKPVRVDFEHNDKNRPEYVKNGCFAPPMV